MSQLQPAMAAATDSAQPSHVAAHTAAPRQPDAVGRKAASTEAPLLAGAASRRAPPSSAVQPAQSAPAKQKMMTPSGRWTAGGSEVRAAAAALAAQDVFEQEKVNGARQQQDRSSNATTAAALLSSAADELSGGQQRATAGLSAGVPQSLAARTPAMLARTPVLSARDTEQSEPADAKATVAAKANAVQTSAAMQPVKAAAVTPAAASTARKWQPSPKMQAALDADGTAAPPVKAASQAAVKSEPEAARGAAADAAETQAVQPRPVAARVAEVEAEAEAGHAPLLGGAKRQRPAKLAAMSAAAAPAARSADGKAPAVDAVLSAAAVKNGERSHVAAMSASAAAAPAQQRSQPAAKQRLQPAARDAPPQRTAKSLPVKAEPRPGSSALTSLKVRASSIKKEARTGALIGAKRLGEPSSRAASAELPTMKRAPNQLPAAADAVSIKPKAAAHAPSGPLPGTLKHSGSAGQLAQLAAKAPVRPTLVPASPEWGAAPPSAAARPVERKTQIGGPAARPALLASIQSVLANAAGAPRAHSSNLPVRCH